MSSSKFSIIKHKIPCQYIREYPHALAGSEQDTLYLSVKQYIPRNNPNPQPGDVTIIAAHANGIPKELYEPLWDDLLAESEAKQNDGAGKPFRIRSIWITDVASQGESSHINQALLGNDPSWSDHARDLLHMINLKRSEMPPPLVGIGHSLGGAQMVDLSLIHSRLLSTVILLDPVIQMRTSEIDPNALQGPVVLSTWRRDVWESREVAAASFRRSKFYQAWDSRVLDLWIQHGLREVEEEENHQKSEKESSPKSKSKPVTLSTSIAQEVWLFLRPNYGGSGEKGHPIDRTTHADVDPDAPINYPFYRPEPARIFKSLPHLRPSALYLLATDSYVSGVDPTFDRLKIQSTGTGVGGSGGVEQGRVKAVELKNTGHMIPLERPTQTARLVAEWVGNEVGRWKDSREEWNRMWKGKSLKEKQSLDSTWKDWMGGRPGVKRSVIQQKGEKAKM
ncbi:hypothetical protein B0A52_05868 [Exophiala mesophila]|uniref:AB hydrolase-1 domain-containing protein n=1 Tax=Exophiala mesophila TaxID=212818 RepID=A0A438N3P6_EXOME|nr:hypothetical protein B0A52_05868 [Exophiala mesophila]